MRVYFRTLKSLPLIYTSAFMPVLHWDSYCTFVVNFEIRKWESSKFVLLFQDCFGYFGCLEFLKKLYIYIFSSFRFTTKLRGRYRDFPYTPCLHTSIDSPTINVTHQSGIFVTRDELKVTHHNHPKSIVYIRVHSWCYTFYGFGQMYNDIYSSLWYHTAYYHCLKNPEHHIFIHSPSPNPRQTLFTVSIGLPFPECHIVGII